MLHVVVVTVVTALIFAILNMREDRQLPGSRLAATYSNEPADGRWGHFIKHEGRDPVISILEREYGVSSITVAIPDSTLVYRFWRSSAETEWTCSVDQHSSVEAAAQYVRAGIAPKVTFDGGEFGSFDGVPDLARQLDEVGWSTYRLLAPEHHLVKREPPSPR